MTVDATYCGNFSRFLNHSHEPNLQVYNIQHDEPTPRLLHLCFFAIRNIRPFEELTFDYQYERAKEKEKQITCYCGAKKCPGWLR